jgi:hypothetical protein
VAGGFRPGEKWQVAERLSGTMFVFARENERKNFDLTSKGKWSLYDTEEMVMSVGDQIRITEGFRERGVAFRTNDIEPCGKWWRSRRSIHLLKCTPRRSTCSPPGRLIGPCSLPIAKKHSKKRC